MVDQIANQVPGQQTSMGQPGGDPAGFQGQEFPQPEKKGSKWLWWVVGVVVVVVLLGGVYIYFF